MMHKINNGDYEWLGCVSDTLGEMSYWFRSSGGSIPKYKEGEKHIVYIATKPEETFDNIVYIGSGKGTRYKHVKSGTSHNRFLNDLYFKGEDLNVMVFAAGLSQAESLKLEKELIAFYNPPANTCGKVDMSGSKYVSKFEEMRLRKKVTT